jgi:hypothetical protein
MSALPVLSNELKKELTVVESKHGGVVLQVCSYCPKAHNQAMRDHGFSWDAEAKVLLRLHVDETATLEDLLATDAFCAKFVHNPVHKIVFKLRSFTPSFVFSAIAKLLRPHSAIYDRSTRSWTIELERWKRRELEAIHGSASQERARKQDADVRFQAAMENKTDSYYTGFQKRQREWETLRAQDSSFARRDYEYTQRLKLMRQFNDFEVGTDGAPNWPDPPVPKGFSRY